MNIMETVKSHPYVIGGVAIGGVILLVLLNSGGSAVSSTPTDSGSSTGNDYNNMLAQIQGSIAQSQVAAGAQAEHDAASLQGLQIQANSQDFATQLAAQVAQFTTQKQADVAIGGQGVQENADTLTAQTQQKAIDAQVQTAAINANAIIQNTSLVANAIGAQQQRSCGLLGGIFGC